MSGEIIISLLENTQSLTRAIEVPVELLHNKRFEKFLRLINRTYCGSDRFGAEQCFVIDIKNSRFVTGPFVGFAIFNDKKQKYLIEIFPKIYIGIDNLEKKSELSMKLFFKLLDLYLSLGLRESDFRYIETKGDFGIPAFFDFIVYLFAKILSEELSFSAYSEFIEVETEESFLRGTLLVEKQLMKLPYQRHTFSLRYEKFSRDNNLNRVFKYAVYLGLQYARWPKARNKLYYIWDNLSDVSLVQISPYDLFKISWNHLNLRFKTAFELAKIIILGATDTSGNILFPGFFVKMWELFEHLAYHIIRYVAREEWIVLSNREPHNLPKLIKEENSKRLFMMGSPQPDIIIQDTNSNPLIVGDVKYKSLYHPKGNVRRYSTGSHDLYQIYTYAKLANTNAMLIYPRLSGEGGYNQWISDISDAIYNEENSTFTFFDGTKLGIIGIDFRHILNNDIQISRGRIIKIKRNISNSFREYIEKLMIR